jgi:hypothetical protein
LIVKLAPLEIDAMRGPVGISAVVLHVTLSRVPAEAVCVMMMLLLVAAAVVLTWQVPVEAAVAQANAPEDAVAQVTTEGLAAVPDAEQLAAVLYFELLVPPVFVMPVVVTPPEQSTR